MGQFSKELQEGGREERRRRDEARREGRREGGREEMSIYNTLVLSEILQVQQGSTHIGLSSYDEERTHECVPLLP